MGLMKVAEESRASIEHDDLKELLPLVAKIKPQFILEIGMHQGYSMEVWRKAFNPKILVGLEKDAPTPVSYVAEPDMLWEADSHDPAVFKKISSERYDFLFIDGDHSYEGVKQDFEMYAPLVRKGGIIVLHDVDYFSDDPNAPVMVKPFWEEIRKKYRAVVINKGKNSTGMGVLFT